MMLTVGIDASRNRSGGARAHMIGILSSLDPEQHGIGEVHLWAFRSLLDAIPDRPWLVKHNPPALEQSLAKQLWWQAVRLTKEARGTGCDILFASDASTLCRFSPMVVLSQDMLSYEPGVMQHFGWGYARLRLLALLYLQNAAFRRAQGVIFLTRYVGKVIQESCGRISLVAVIPHGVDDAFRECMISGITRNTNQPIRCLYISPISRFKHQWHVVRAIKALRDKGYPIELLLVGDSEKSAATVLAKELDRSDPRAEFVKQLGHVPRRSLPTVMSNSDIFIFASSCEALPITLLEGMSAGFPIACSNRSSLPETLEDGGIYFDPEIPNSISNSVQELIDNEVLRLTVAKRAKELSIKYSWASTAKKTFDFIRDVHKSTSDVRG